MFSKKTSAKVKGVAILLLLFHHLFYNAERVQDLGICFILFPEEIIYPLAVSARICVWIFVFISAYGLTYQYMNRKNESKLQFAVKRWLSLMQTYWFAYFIFFFMLCIISKYPFKIYENIVHMFLDFMGWADFFGTPTLTGVWWYMCFAQILIWVIPLLDTVCKHLGWSSLVVVYLGLQYLPEGLVSPYGGMYSNYFIVAVLAALCAQSKIFDKLLKHPSNKKVNIMGCLGGLVGVLLLLALKLLIADFDQWQLSSLLSALAALFICIIIGKYVNNTVLDSILSFLGHHSGNMFMIHAFFYADCPESVYWSSNALMVYCSLLILSLGMSMLIEYAKKIIKYNLLFENIKKHFLKALD